MSVKLGNIAIKDIPLGNMPIGKAYLGDVLVYRKGETHPYLEIEPELIWVYTDWSAHNDVHSNTTWDVQ